MSLGFEYLKLGVSRVSRDTRVSYGRLKGVSVSQGCSQGVFRLFQGVFKGVSKVLLGCFMCV